jgi:hypothetical protein
MQKLLFPNPSQNIDCKIFPMMVAHKGTLSKLRSGGAFVQSLLTLGSQISWIKFMFSECYSAPLVLTKDFLFSFD